MEPDDVAVDVDAAGGTGEPGDQRVADRARRRHGQRTAAEIARRQGQRPASDPVGCYPGVGIASAQDGNARCRRRRYAAVGIGRAAQGLVNTGKSDQRGIAADGRLPYCAAETARQAGLQDPGAKARPARSAWHGTLGVCRECRYDVGVPVAVGEGAASTVANQRSAGPAAVIRDTADHQRAGDRRVVIAGNPADVVGAGHAAGKRNVLDDRCIGTVVGIVYTADPAGVVLG